MYFNNLNAALDYLTTVGGYELDGKLKKANYESEHSYEMRIIQIATRISVCMEKYPNEIHDYLLNHEDKQYIPLEILKKMKYTELSELRRSLGIKKKTAKKVTSSTEAAETTISAAKEHLKNQSVSETVKDIYISNYEAEDLQMLSLEEIRLMYPDLPSVEELREKGIIPENIFQYESAIEEDQKNTLKKL